ncbi:hypothetical protein RCO27_04310 [Sphingosinicella sp. LHD-64]|uniref:hypothetical protein n=1 Tax=Sphingosinicella sp. LHD-64 TaxID=3072139 RepID=UPI0028106722|nr:hypothetical protein [Sphingosinicella sp. LHD-64]MDQ8755445.1 hypothetical protein [Sphingosinicella sp. LHD-64]
MDSVGGGAPSFPLPILIAVTALLAVPLYFAARGLRGDAARFLIGAIWLRYILSVFHVITFRDFAAGLSLTAIGSILVTGLGLLLVDKRYLLLKALVPVYALIGIALISAELNAGLFTALDTVVKYVYFCTLLIATYEALKDNLPGDLFRRLILAFAPLLAFQILSVATGLVKASELDGSRSYIGGYNHEAAFSVALVTFFIVVSFATGLARWLKFTLLASIFAGVALANYRTSIIALLPFVAHVFISRTAGLFRPRQRWVLLGAGILLAFVTLAITTAVTGERFGDLAIFLTDPGAYIKPQEQFTLEERRLLSGRAYIWSGYIYAWSDSTQWQHLFGFGPDSWSDWFRVYPHNTVIAFLFELGLAGLAVLLWWWAAMFRLASRARRPVRTDLVVAQCSFILLNLATMALWQIEGLILFALICGYALFSAVHEGAVRREGRQRFESRGDVAGRKQVGGPSRAG